MSKTSFRLAVLAIAICATAALINQASAAGASVERACASDYFSYCSQHSPDSPAVRSCMRSNGSRLSQRCVNALVAAGEVSPSDVQRRSAKK